MKCGLKVEYACRVLSHMGADGGAARLFQINDLARAENVPAKFLGQILNELRLSGIIESKRGKSGGYRLGRAAETISLYEVIKAVDAEMLAAPRRPSGQSGAYAAAVWREISEAFEAQLKSRTVASLIPKAKALNWQI